MIIIKRTELSINTIKGLEATRGSNDIKIELINDMSYPDYVEQIHCGYVLDGVQKDILLAKDEEGNFLIPGVVFANLSPMYIGLGLVKDNEIIKTNQITFMILNSPSGTTVLPSEATWQQLVSDFSRGLFDAYTTTEVQPILDEAKTNNDDTKTIIETFEEEYANAINLQTEVAFQKPVELQEPTSPQTVPAMMGNQSKAVERVLQLNEKLIEVENEVEGKVSALNGNFESVPMINGVPFVERGSNENGVWEKWWDGRLYMSHTVTVPGGTNKSVNWPFPIASVSSCKFFLAANSTVPSVLNPPTYSGGDYKTNTNIYVNRSTATETIVNVKAEGYWK